VNTSDARNLAIVAVIAVAPLAIVLIFAMLRGYTIHLTAFREELKRHRRSNDDE
jgi:hypothetical protein